MLRKPDWKYGWGALAGDVCGGIIAALIAIPYGLAMAVGLLVSAWFPQWLQLS